MTARALVAHSLLWLGLAAATAACGDSGGSSNPPGNYPAHCSDGAKTPGETDVDCGGPCAPCRNGKACAANTDCAAGYCGAGYLCWPANCGDGAKGLTETDIDCGGPCPACFGAACSQNAQCLTGFCDGATCAASSCTDGQKNGKETGVDCGGADCPSCADGQTCLANAHCQSGFCNLAGVCAAPSCTDAVKNQGESDVDCGGPCGPCAGGKLCGGPADCESMKCVNSVCGVLASSCLNGAKDQDETDIDCGGACAPCGFGKACAAPEDCRSSLCQNSACTAPATCTDAQLSPGESDVDCGGDGCPPCALGKTCRTPLDCFTVACHDGLCDEPNGFDATKNGLETDADCGGGDAGSGCGACADSKRCKIASDCQGGSCSGGFCGSCTDGQKNGDESDVDCGGACAPCGLDKGCNTNADCASGACADGKTCCTPNACGFCGALGAETCNGVDDDCNGQTDDALAAELCANQQGVCAGAKATCGGAAGWQCGPSVLGAHHAAWQASESTCDKLDNDCNGQTDEPGCAECAVAQEDVAGFAQGAGEVRIGQDFVTMHQGKAAMAFVKEGSRPDLVIATPGDYDLKFTDLDGAPAIASDGTNLFVAFTEDLNSGSIRSLIVRKLLGFDYHTLQTTSDVAAQPFSPALAVGGGHAAVVWPDETYKLQLAVSETTDFGTGWDTFELDSKPDALAQVAVGANGVAHAVWRTNQGQGELQHFTGGTKVSVGVTANDFAIAVSATGELHLVTREGVTVKHRVWSAGAWGGAVPAGTTDADSDVALALDPSGVAYVAFRASPDKVKIVRKGATSFTEVAVRTVTSTSSDIASVAGFGFGIDAKGVAQIGAASYDASLPGWRYASFVAACSGYGDGGTCTPNCSGKTCGDNGCGGSCGNCPNGTSCTAAGQCQGGCTPDCNGRICGDNGCGGSCGSCQGGQTCNALGQCESGAGQCGGDPTNTCYGRCGLYDASWSCQCDANCAQTGDCCPDKGSCCTATSCGSGPTSCGGGQCGQYVEGRACNCDGECMNYYDCCPDIVPCCAQ